MCVKWADRQWTDCRVNTQLLFGPCCTLRLHDSLHVLLIQCALWRRDSFLCLAVHSLLSGGEICTSDSDEFRRRVCTAQTVNALHRLCFDKLRPDFKFNGARKCLFLNYCTLAVMLGDWIRVTRCFQGLRFKLTRSGQTLQLKCSVAFRCTYCKEKKQSVKVLDSFFVPI